MNASRASELSRLDALARERVRTSFAGAIVLEAGAGTGKTTTLVARVVAWLLGRGFDAAERAVGPDAGLATAGARALDGVLAITFTDAAAADMDHKIREALVEIEGGRMPPGLDEGSFACASSTLRARASALRRALDRPLARTIHAFCRALLAEHALAAGLHPLFEVDVDGARVREVAREAVVRDLAARLADPAETEWRLLAQREIGPGAVLEACIGLALEGARAEDLGSDPFPLAVVRAIEDELRLAAEEFLRDCAAPLRAAASGTARYGEVCAAVETLAGLLARPAERVEDLHARARVAADHVGKYARERLAAFGAGEISNALAKKLGPAQERVVTCSRVLWERLAAWSAFDPELDRAARGVIARVLGAVRATLARTGVETFGDLLRDAAGLLRERPGVLARVRDGLGQILVDEFQDTDPVQCEIVSRLAFPPAPARRPGLLVVGDPKQSIYGFRSADLRAYEDFVERALAEGGEKLVLSRNFRSQEAILDHVERVMSVGMVGEPGLQPPFEPLFAARPPESARIEHWNAALAAGARQPGVREARVEASHLARELRAANERGVAWHDLGVLLRTRAPLEALLEALRAAGIPFDVAGDRSYYRRREVQDAAALLAAILDPSDELALVACLRSPWVGVPDALWLPLRAEAEEDSFFTHAAELDARRPRTLAAALASVGRALARLPDGVPASVRAGTFQPALEHALESLAILRASFATEPADVFLERLRALFLLEATSGARYQGSYRVANLERFLAEVARELEDNGGDVQRLLRAVRGAIADALDASEARPRDSGRSAVQIQTIHGAKGLDYREVFVLGLRATTRKRTPKTPRTRIHGDAWILFGAPNPAWIAHARAEERREEAELVRLLYVAMTRAKDRLVLSGALPPRRKDGDEALGPDGMLGLLLPAFAGEIDFLRDGEGGVGDERIVEGVHYRRLQAEHAEHASADTPYDARATAERAARDAERLIRDDRLSAIRRARPLVRAMSMPTARAEPFEEPRTGAPMAPGSAALAGTALHALLEELPLAGDLAPALARAEERIEEHVRQAAEARGVLDPAVLGEAVSRARALLTRLRAGPLAGELRRIAPHVLARELALLVLDRADDGFAGTAAGAIDLLHRDPATGELVIVDFKTDAVASLDEARRAAERHRPQVDAYRRALAAALGLPREPRGELWFLDAGAIVPVA